MLHLCTKLIKPISEVYINIQQDFVPLSPHLCKKICNRYLKFYTCVSIFYAHAWK